MKLENIQEDAVDSLIYLDRYVNDGSPSGFTEKYKTSFDTDPFNSKKSFYLPAIEAQAKDFIIYGTIPKNIPLKENQIYIHPDMESNRKLVGLDIVNGNSIKVTPTSSFRTVKLLSNECSDFIKLHYDGIIGRIYRQLYPMRAKAGVEISGILKKAIKSDSLSSFISIYEEPFAKLIAPPAISSVDQSWGMVWRKATPTGKHTEQIVCTVPLFSIWSKDRNFIEEDCLGKQLFDRWANAKAKNINDLLLKLLDNYFEIIVKEGLQNEYNAQNILLGFDKDWNIVSIINRDLMGLEKDIVIRKANGLTTDFDSAPYKVLSPDSEFYSIRHSFAFDFKVCYYVINPIVKLAERYQIASRVELIDALRERTKFWLSFLPHDYLPKGKWFSHENVLLTETRNYIQHSHPLLRD